MQLPRLHPIRILGHCPENEVTFTAPPGMGRSHFHTSFSSWRERSCECSPSLLARGSRHILPSTKCQELTRRMNRMVSDSRGPHHICAQSCLTLTTSSDAGTISFLFYRWSNWDSRSRSDLPRITQKVAEPGHKSRVRGRWEPRLPSLQVKVLSLGDPTPPRSEIMSHSTSCLHLGLHLSSQCHSHRSWLSLYPSQGIRTFTSRPSVVKRNISTL